MKSFHNLEVISYLKNNYGKSNFKNYSIEKIADGYIFNWDYQCTSFACQGHWSSFVRFIDLSKDYVEELNKFKIELTEFIKIEYKECFKSA